MENKKQKNLIAQSKELVEAKYNFNLWELRLFIEVLQQIDKNDKDFKRYRLYYQDIIAQYGKGKKDYKYIRNASLSLLRKVVHFDYVTEDGIERTYHAVLFTAADTPKNWREIDESMYIDFKVNSDLKDQLIELKKNYLLYDKRNILRLRSKFAVRIYQILKSYEWENRESVVVELSVAELRLMLLVDENGDPTKEYPKYYMFKRRVLLQAQKEIQEHTDIAFSFEEIKKGRRVDVIRFYLRKNRKNKTQNPKGKTQSPQRKTPTKPRPVEQVFEEQSEALQALIRSGIGVDKAFALIATLGEEVALDELKYAQNALKNSHNVKSETGFIIRMMEKESYTKSQAIKEAEQKAKKKKAALHKAQVVFQKQQIANLREEYTTERNKAINNLLKDLDKVEVAKLVEKYAKKKPHIQKAIKQAEKKGNTKEANDFKYGLFVQDLDEYLQSFEEYIERMYEFKLKEVGSDQFLVAMD